MRAWHWSGLLVLLFLFGASGVRADEPSGAPSADGAQRHPAASVVEQALEALKLRMEARIHEGELLARTGRLEEALEAYRSVGLLYDQGMQAVRRLIADLGRVAPAPAPAVPAESFGAEEVQEEPMAGPFARRRARRAPEAMEAAILRALDWLKAHQSPSGKWGATEFADWCNGKLALGDEFRPDGQGQSAHDVGVTGLALLAYLGAGYTPQGGNPYAETISNGFKYLRSVQDAEGCIGPRTHQQYMYSHGIASLAVAEAYGLTHSPILERVAQRALDFIAKARNPHMAWRYGVKPGDDDTSVSAWMVMALKSADVINKSTDNAAPLRIDAGAWDGARAWLDKVTDPDYGRVGYQQRGSGPARRQEMLERFPAKKSEAMTAAGILMRVFLGESPRKSAMIKKGAELCRKLPPVWNTEDGSIDMVYWYHGTLAMFQVGGMHWRDWKKALDLAVRDTQRLDTDACLYRGSWDPVGAWGSNGGRVASTALMTLCLEVSAYGRSFGTR